MHSYIKVISFSSFFLTLVFILVSCSNWKTKELGGTSEFTLPKGEKLVNVTWKGTDLWYVTKPMTNKDSVETYSFTERSNLGIMSGKYIIHETR